MGNVNCAAKQDSERTAPPSSKPIEVIDAPPKSATTLRIYTVNDVYILKNLGRFKEAIKQESAKCTADLSIITLPGDFISPSLLSALEIGEVATKHESIITSLRQSVLCKIPPAVSLSSKNIRLRPVTMGIFICNLLRSALKTEVALVTAGSIRANKDYPPDITEFTYLDLEQEVPFDCGMMTMHLPGQVLQDMIIYSRRTAHQEGVKKSGNYFQTCDAIITDPNTDVITSILDAPLDPKRMYEVAILHEVVAGLGNIEPLVTYAKSQNLDYTYGEFVGLKEVLISHFCLGIWHDMLFAESFDQLDKNGDGVVSKDELKAALAAKGHGLSDQIIDNVFSIADPDGSAVLSRSEFTKIKELAMKGMNFSIVNGHAVGGANELDEDEEEEIIELGKAVKIAANIA
ncbi:hypothetical protein HDU99_008337 [Rhizoclosmatium hyalinum]|nr:hypothetical protein HDU99_008337 [Rhizoclosmatium hyalinum]